MKIQLLKTIPELGVKGQIIEVRDAYARNYLLPHSIGRIATTQVVTEQKLHVDQKSHKDARLTADLARAQKRLCGAAVRLQRPASDQGKLFAAVHSNQIISALNSQFKLSLSGLRTEPEHLKNTGSHQVALHWPGGGASQITVLIEASAAR